MRTSNKNLIIISVFILMLTIVIVSALTITVTLNSPEDNFNLGTPGEVTFNCSGQSDSLELANISLYLGNSTIWNLNETFNIESTAWNIETASYDSVSFDISSEDSDPFGFDFKSDGTKMYFIGAQNDRVFQYSLSTAWNVGTASYDSVSFDISSEYTIPFDLFFKSDGTKMYFLGAHDIFQYSLSTAWNVGTASYDSVSFDASSQNDFFFGFSFKSDGTKMYVMGDNDRVYQYSLSTAWNVGTASYDSVSFDATSEDDDIHGFDFKSDGTKMYFIGAQNDRVYQYSLSTAWNVGTASYDSVSFDMSSEDTAQLYLFLKSDGTKMYSRGNSNNRVYQYSLIETDYTKTFVKNISKDTIWNCEFCTTDGTCSFAITNRTIFLDNNPPIITINYPNETTHESSEIIFNITAIDEKVNIDYCLYSLDNSENISMNNSYFEGAYTEYLFDTWGNGNRDQRDIIKDETYFWITDISDGEVYKYYINGTYTGDSFNTEGSGNALPTGITKDETYFWIIDFGKKVYKYYINGTYTGDSFNTDGSGNGAPAGITKDETYFWITDNIDYEVYKYYINGTYTGDSFDTGGSGNTNPYGITKDETYFWITNNFNDEVYKYYINGTYTGYSFDTGGSGNGDPLGITKDETYFWITDYVDGKVYRYYVEDSSNYIVTNSHIVDGEHEVKFYCNDTFGNMGSSNITFITDTESPVITIDLPEATTYGTNESLPLNYTISDLSTIDSCFYNIVNSTSNKIIENTTLTNCENITFDVPRSDSYTLKLYANDTLGNLGSSSITFSVSLEAPVIDIVLPLDNTYLNNSKNINFSFLATDEDGLDTCIMYSNITGFWSDTETFSSITSGVLFSTLKNLTENIGYKFTLWCNDTLGNSDFYFKNDTFIIDEINPLTIIKSITTTENSQIITFNSSTSDLNLDSCYYSIYNKLGLIDGTNENITFNCNELSQAIVTSFGNFNLTIYAEDLAGNINSDTLGFTTSISIPSGGGGGGTTIIFTGKADWIMEVAKGIASYDKSMPSGTSKNLGIQFENIGDSSQSITLSCEDTRRNMCQYVTFKETSFELPLIKDIKLKKDFTITLPKEIEKGEYKFNIIATDMVGRSGVITVTITTGGEDILLETLSKIGLDTEGGVPYILIFIPSLIFLFFLTTKLIPKKTPAKALIVIGSSGFISLLVIYLI